MHACTHTSVVDAYKSTYVRRCIKTNKCFAHLGCDFECTYTRLCLYACIYVHSSISMHLCMYKIRPQNVREHSKRGLFFILLILFESNNTEEIPQSRNTKCGIGEKSSTYPFIPTLQLSLMVSCLSLTTCGFLCFIAFFLICLFIFCFRH